MDKKAKNTMIVSVIALALVLIGVTYAYFSARITGLESASTISLTAGRMGIVYSEDDATVSVSNIYPREEAWITKQITLTGWNTTNQEMKYELGLNIDSNTFKGGQLTFDLTGVGTNGTKIADITGKSITKTSGFFKFGTGIFLQSDGDTHVYTLKIYFKDNGKDQNMNQEAVFNAKIDVREYGSNIATANQNHNGKHCYTDDYVEGATPTNGTEYVNGQYTYKYNYYASGDSFYKWTTTAQVIHNGWGMILTDPNSTDPVTTELCAYINEIPIIKMTYVFQNSKATSIDLSSFDTSNVTDMAGMFLGSSATVLDLSSFDTSNVTNMSRLFEGSKVSSLDLSSFDTTNVTSMSRMFADISSLRTLDLSTIDTSNVTNMYMMFWRNKVDNLDLSMFDTAKVENMSSMFSGSNATTINLSSFDTTNVTNMSSMFSSYYGNNSPDLSSFDTSNVTNMWGMFENTYFKSIDLSTFDTSNVTDMGDMFFQSQVNVLDLSSFNTSKVTNMPRMFYNCYGLTTIYVSNKFTINSLNEDSSNPYGGSFEMFKSASKLVGGAGTTYDVNHINRDYAHVDGGTSNPGYFTAK